MSYPQEPGVKSADDTTIAAAASMSEKAVTLRRRILELLGGLHPLLTAHEIAARLHESDKATSPRISELRALGQVRDTGQRGYNASGRRAIIWGLAR